MAETTIQLTEAELQKLIRAAVDAGDCKWLGYNKSRRISCTL